MIQPPTIPIPKIKPQIDYSKFILPPKTTTTQPQVQPTTTFYPTVTYSPQYVQPTPAAQPVQTVQPQGLAIDPSLLLLGGIAVVALLIMAFKK